MDHLVTLTDAIKSGNRKAAVSAVEGALKENLPAGDILEALITGMNDVGRRFKANEIFVPEVLISARAMKESMVLLEPELVAAGIQPKFTAIIGTVQGDLHDIGKNLVTMMWKGANFRVIDLGTNVPPARFVEEAKTHNADLVGLSALLTTTMPAMRDTVTLLREANLPKTKIIIGGAPITRQFAEEIKADGFAEDAATAVDVARELVGA